MATSDAPQPPLGVGARPAEADDGGAPHLRWHAGRQLLVYEPDGPLGGTFTCTRCAAQAWQPDLLPHALNCPFGQPA